MPVEIRCKSGSKFRHGGGEYQKRLKNSDVFYGQPLRVEYHNSKNHFSGNHIIGKHAIGNHISRNNVSGNLISGNCISRKFISGRPCTKNVLDETNYFIVDFATLLVSTFLLVALSTEY